MRAILTWHSLDDSGSAISLAPDVFRAQVAWLASGRVRVVPLEEIARVPAGDDAVALTFDDAFANFDTVAAPLLRAYQLPATVFVVTENVGQTNTWGGRPDPRVPELPLMDWESLAALTGTGISLGGHSRTHPLLSRLPAPRLEDEILGSAAIIAERTGAKVRSFAYPYGDVSTAAAALVRSRFSAGVTTELRALAEREDAALLPRLDMYYFRSTGALERWGSLRFKCTLRARAGARMLKRQLVTFGAHA